MKLIPAGKPLPPVIKPKEEKEPKGKPAKPQVKDAKPQEAEGEPQADAAL